MPAAQRGVAREEHVRGFGFGQIRRTPREFPVGVPRRGHDGEQGLGGGFIEQRAVAAQQAAGRGVFLVDGHGVGQRRDVAVQKQQVVARRGADGQVAGGGEPVAVLFLPHDLGRKAARGQQAFHGDDGGGIGAVVGHDEFVGRAGLRGERGRQQAQVVGPVVDRREDADLHAASFGGGCVRASPRPMKWNSDARITLSGKSPTP